MHGTAAVAEWSRRRTRWTQGRSDGDKPQERGRMRPPVSRRAPLRPGVLTPAPLGHCMLVSHFFSALLTDPEKPQSSPIVRAASSTPTTRLAAAEVRCSTRAHRSPRRDATRITSASVADTASMPSSVPAPNAQK